MSFEIIGKIVSKSPTAQKTDTFRTREFVVEKTDDINGRIIPNYIKFQLVQDKCTYLDRYNEGDTIKVSFNLRGTRWEKEGKVNYFTNLDAWRIEAMSPVTGGPAPERAPEYGNSQVQPMPPAEVVDDLPF
jgi:hypothetical protein